MERLDIEKRPLGKTEVDTDMEFKVAERVRGLLNIWEEKVIYNFRRVRHRLI